jgi:hypothetical protein
VTLPKGVVPLSEPPWFAFVCECCGRMQGYAPPSRVDGLTARQAEAKGWARDLDDKWTCPICMGRMSVSPGPEEGARHRRCCMAFKRRP